MNKPKSIGIASEVKALSPSQQGFDSQIHRATTSELLALGGDGRVALDPAGAVNKYGCPARPDPGLADFGSSTASVISTQAYAAADALHTRLTHEPGASRTGVYAREMDRVRGELKAFCGLADAPGVEVVFAASGTDLHLLVRELVGGTPNAPLLCLGVEPEETGSGVPAALCGRHFSDRAALGEVVENGAPIGPEVGDFIAVRARKGDGALRDGHLIEAELDALCLHATRTGRRVLLTVADVSKTGLIAPSLETVMALRRRFPNSLEVLVDACQFRLAPATLRAYLDNDLMVAVTGSKFLTGPVFSGALFVPPAAAERLSGRLLRPALRPYSARADWPRAWIAGRGLPDAANEGLLLRWEAALAELKAFRALPETEVATFAVRFADTVRARLSDDAMFEPLPVRALDRRAIGASGGWDEIPTIFPFLVRERPGQHAPFQSVADAQNVFRNLLTGCIDGLQRARVGQPVFCGERDGSPIAALRLCNSARLIAEGVRDPDAVISRALSVLDQVARVASRLAQAGRIYS